MKKTFSAALLAIAFSLLTFPVAHADSSRMVCESPGHRVEILQGAHGVQLSYKGPIKYKKTGAVKWKVVSTSGARKSSDGVRYKFDARGLFPARRGLVNSFETNAEVFVNFSRPDYSRLTLSTQGCLRSGKRGARCVSQMKSYLEMLELRCESAPAPSGKRIASR